MAKFTNKSDKYYDVLLLRKLNVSDIINIDLSYKKIQDTKDVKNGIFKLIFRIFLSRAMLRQLFLRSDDQGA